MGRCRRLSFLSIAGVVAVLAVGLFGGIGAAVAADSSSPAASASAAAGDVVYKVGIPNEPDNLNPYIGYGATSFEIWYLTYDSLVGYDYGTLQPTRGQDSTGLATDWSVSADGKTWTFTIRSGVKWQDGVPLTAADVAFSYNYVIKNNLTNFSSYVEGIKKAVAVNDTTVRFICDDPKANMLGIWVPIVPEHVWSKVSGKDAAAKYANAAPYVGSGPFQCVEWKKNSYVKLVANKDYWRGSPHIDELYFEYYTNSDSMVEDLKTGAIDAAASILSAQYRQLRDSPGIEARTIRTNGFDELGINCYEGTSQGNPVLKDARFRQALNLAIDKDRICSITYGGHATPSTTVITSDYYSDPDWHWEPDATQKFTFDPAKAKQLLDAAGYRDTDGDGIREYKGKPIELRLVSRSDSLTSQSSGKLIAGWFKSIGLKIDLTTMDDGALSDDIYATKNGKLDPDYDMFIWGWYSDYDPGSLLSYFTTSQIGAWSDCGWSDKEYDKLFTEQSRTLDTTKRKALIDRMQQILYEQSPYIVLAYSNDLEAYNTDKWEGYIASPSKVGNVLFPPYGNAGNENYLSIRPKTASESTAGGSGRDVWIVVVVAAVVVVAIVVAVVRRGRGRAIEE